MKTLWLLMIASVIFTSCATTSEAGNKLYSQQQFENQLAKNELVLLDVRTPEEYKEGHLKNAVLLDYNGGVFDKEYTQLDKTKTYLLYCKSGRRSDNAATKMKAAGFGKVYQLKGGILAWTGSIEKE